MKRRSFMQFIGVAPVAATTVDPGAALKSMVQTAMADSAPRGAFSLPDLALRAAPRPELEETARKLRKESYKLSKRFSKEMYDGERKRIHMPAETVYRGKREVLRSPEFSDGFSVLRSTSLSARWCWQVKLNKDEKERRNVVARAAVAAFKALGVSRNEMPYPIKELLLRGDVEEDDD